MHLQHAWQDLFDASFDVLLYDLTSTYFECDRRSPRTTSASLVTAGTSARDCVQVVIALVVTPEGFPAGIRSAWPATPATRPRWRAFWKRSRAQYGKAQRIWVMDRGIPTEETLEQMRRAIRRCSIWWAPPRGA